MRQSQSKKIAQDGEWHMITLTTLAGQPGFAMYIDGYLSAEMSPYTGTSVGYVSLHEAQIPVISSCSLAL